MNDDQLDDLLDRGRRAWSAEVTAATAVLVHTTRQHVDETPTRRRRSRPLVVAGVVAATIALTAGAGVTAAQLGIPPFQTLPAGLTRIATAVPIDYVQADGTRVSCKGFMEFSRIDGPTEARLEAAIASHDWSSVGQTAYDDARARGGGADAESMRFGTAVDEALLAQATATVPDLVRPPATSGSTVWNGSSLSCSKQTSW